MHWVTLQALSHWFLHYYLTLATLMRSCKMPRCNAYLPLPSIVNALCVTKGVFALIQNVGHFLKAEG
jgi:hypothetical protein